MCCENLQNPGEGKMKSVVLLGLMGLVLVAGCRDQFQAARPPVVHAAKLDEQFSAQRLEALKKIESVLVRGEPVEPFAENLHIVTTAEAYRVQNFLSHGMTGYQGKIVGYKLALTSKAMRDQWQADEPIHAPLYELGQWQQSKKLDPAEKCDIYVEAEIAFVMGKNVSQEISSVEDILPCIQSAHVALDMAALPFKGKPNVLDLIMVGAGSYGFVLGDRVKLSDLMSEGLVLSLRHGGREIRSGQVQGLRDGPFKALLWLSNKLLSEGNCLRAGDIVLTGAVASPYRVESIDQQENIFEGRLGQQSRVRIQTKPSSF